MLDTQQVMLWNESSGEYQLARVGDEVEGWRVIAVVPEAKRAVVLRRGTRDELYLAQMPRPNAPVDPRVPRLAPVIIADACSPETVAVAAAAAPAVTAAPVVAAPPPAPVAAPVNPYAAPAPQQLAPVNPYATPASVGAPAPPAPPVAAPVNPYAAPAPAPQGLPIGPPPPAPLAAPVAPDPAAGAPLPIESHSLTRAELNRELRDFDRLLAGITVAPAAGGGFVLTRVEPRSWVQKLGLRSGDVVRTVAGEPVSTLEDAARVYARLGSLDSFVVVVERGQQKLLLSYSVR
jgi:hypothetical protein